MGQRAKFIVFEGVDHSGKTSQLDRAEAFLGECKVSVARFREPGGTKVGERIREVLLTKDLTMVPETELMLFFAARMELLKKEIMPALRSGKTVLLDRYYYSTAAYQGPFVLSANWVLNLAEDWLRLLEPDLVIYLDGDPEVLARRASGEADRIEEKGIPYQKQVRQAYLEMAYQRPDLFALLDAERPIDTVSEEIKKLLKEHVLERVVHG